MVLKVVTGKILRTLELSCSLQGRSIRDAAACGSILGRRDEVEAAPTVGWSEIIDYLLVDVIAIMLSHVKNQVKEKVEGRGREPVPNRESRGHRFRKERGKGWGSRLVGRAAVCGPAAACSVRSAGKAEPAPQFL
jgi:hypothetical protein